MLNSTVVRCNNDGHHQISGDWNRCNPICWPHPATALGTKLPIEDEMGLHNCFRATALLVTIAFPTTVREMDTCSVNSAIGLTQPAAIAISFHEKQIMSIPDAVDLLIVGDSLAGGWPSTVWAPHSVFNGGIDGDMIENLMWRLSSPAWRRLTPANVLIVVGTNNLARRDCNNAIPASFSALRDQTRAMWPAARFYFLGIPPIGRRGNFRTTERKAINDILGTFISPLAINIDTVLKCESKRCLYFQPDNLHLTKAGYAVITSAIEKAIFGTPK